jgi:hypothetical protein
MQQPPYQPPSDPGPPPGAPGQQSVVSSPKFPGALVLAGAGAATLGAFMPWVEYTTFFVGYRTNGGALAILLALALVGLGAWMLAARVRIGVPIAVVILACLLGLDCVMNIGFVVAQNLGRSTSTFNPPLRLGEGVVVCLVASGLAGIGGVVGILRAAR